MIAPRRLFSILIAILVTQAALASAGSDAERSGLLTTRFQDVQGKPQTLQALRGKPMVVNFWARWCAPCREEIPELNHFHRQHGQRIAVVGIGLEEDLAAVNAFRRQYPMTYRVVLTGEQNFALMKALGNQRGGLPFTVFIDPSGQIVHQKLGRLTAEELETGRRLLQP